MRKIKITSIIIFLSIIMLQFQNCGAAPEGYEEITASEHFTPGLIDDLPNQKLVFVESLIVTKHDADLVNYDGLCSKDSDGKVIDWVLEKISDRSVALEGQAECSRNGFRISAENMLDIDCGEDYELNPYMGEHEDRVIVRRKCDPIVSIEVRDEAFAKLAANNPNLPSKACFFELEASVNDGLESCHKTCYVSAKLYSRTSADMQSCSQ